MRRQVGAAALLARLNEDEDAAAAAARRQQARHGGKHRVAVVGGPPAVEKVAFAHGLVRAEPTAPLAERWLLVQVAVEDDGLARAAVVDQQHGGAARQVHDLDLERGVLVACPCRQELGGLADGAALGPVRVEGGGEARDAGVLAQDGEDPVLPGGVDHAAGHASVISARRSSVLDMDAAVCWPTLGCFKKNACLSCEMSHDSVTFVPPSTGSNS